MWPFNSQKSFHAKSDEYRKKRFCELYKSLVPPLGEAETLQGELLRIIGNAEDEANRNGFMNWDEEDDRDMDLFVDQICEGSIFDEVTRRKIKECAARIKNAAHDTKELLPRAEDWHFMHFRAVDWCDAHPEPIPMRDTGDYAGHF
jgi:hypothetical protein